MSLIAMRLARPTADLHRIRSFYEHVVAADTSAVAWNPAGTQIATGNFDGTLRLFDAATGAPDR